MRVRVIRSKIHIINRNETNRMIFSYLRMRLIGRIEGTKMLFAKQKIQITILSLLEVFKTDLII